MKISVEKMTIVELSDKEISKLAEITEIDIVLAQQWWRKNAPDRFKALLDAKEDANAD